MNIEDYISPQIEKLVRGYGMLRTFLIDTKEHLCSDEIRVISKTGKNCIIEISEIGEHIYGGDMEFCTMYNAGSIQLEFEQVLSLTPNDRDVIESYGYHASIKFDGIMNQQGKLAGVSFAYIHEYSGDSLFKIVAKSVKVLGFKVDGYIE